MKKLPFEKQIKEYFENPLMIPVTGLILFLLIAVIPFIAFGFN